jgi:polar amino acid transport system permease protein
MKKKKINRTDLVVLSCIVAAVIYLIYRLTVGFSYRWNWSVMPQYLFRFNEESGKWVPNMLINGLLTTIRISIWGTLLATIIGVVMGLCRTSRSLFNRLISRTYVELIRNIPPLVIIFLFYFFISDQIMPLLGIDYLIESLSGEMAGTLRFFFADPVYASNFFSALLTLAIFEGAYITEIIRAGIQAIEKGQWEASHALGLSRWQQMRHIILPQALTQILPPLGGQFISLVKDSAIVSVISIQELTFMGTELMSGTYLTIEIWVIVTALYLMITLPCSLLVERLENYMSRSRA